MRTRRTTEAGPQDHGKQPLARRTRLSLTLTDDTGTIVYAADLPLPRVRSQITPPESLSPDPDATDEPAGLVGGAQGFVDVVDAELAAAGWSRAEIWTWSPCPASTLPVPPPDGVGAVVGVGGGAGGGGRWWAPVHTRPRSPVTEADRRVLEALGRLTWMARGPVTAAALVPHVAPRWQAAAVVLGRLVTAGQARAVGRTPGRIARALYAPVGSPWAPEVTGGCTGHVAAGDLDRG